jgi:outer membrane protein
MTSRFFISVIALLSVNAISRSAEESDDCKTASADCVAVGHWNFGVSLGGGVRTNPVANGTNIPLVVIPQFSYYGKRFFIDNLDLGFTLAENDTNTFNLVASPGYDRVYFYRADLQNIFVSGFPTNDDFTATPGSQSPSTPAPEKFPSRTRRITYLAGPEWTFKYGPVTGQLDFLHEITDQNQGNEIRAAIGLPLIERRGILTANVGFTWNSAAYVNYYYGASNVYLGGSALDPFVKLGYTLPLSRKWRFKAFAEYERLAGAIANSPIVAEHHVATVFAGAAYTF